MVWFVSFKGTRLADVGIRRHWLTFKINLNSKIDLLFPFLAARHKKAKGPACTREAFFCEKVAQ